MDFGGGPLVVNDVGSDIASIAIPQTDAGTPPRDGSTTAADVVISGSMILIDLEEQRDQLVQDIKANPDDRDDLMDQLKDISGQAEELRGLLNDPGFLGSDTAGTILTWTPYVVDGGKIIIVAVAVVATTAACGATAGAACVAAVTAAGGTSLAVAGPLSGITGNSIANYNNASAGGNGGAWTAATSVASAVGSQIIDEGSKMVGGKIFGELGGGAVLQMIGGLASNETVKFIIVEVNSSRGGSTSQASLGSYSSGYHAPGSTSTASNGATVHH
ncbi:MAG: hypothetical protein JKY63_06640 [Rhodobiaceae bacterium]|nr:hypothetical protein [Rhodobiaceae bacterium]